MDSEKVIELFGAEQTAARVGAMAREIAAVVPRDVVVVALLKGSFVFVADLVRALSGEGVEPRVEFITVTSYGSRKESSGRVELVGPVPKNLSGRQVLLVDDVADTGRSLVFAMELLIEQGAVRVWTCAAVDKPSRREIKLDLDFSGFSIGEEFVVGYGIDYAEKYRHLPFIGALEETS